MTTSTAASSSAARIRRRSDSKLCYEVNIFDKRPDPTYGTGAIVDIAKVEPMPKAGGKWNTYEITAKGPHLVVVLNGQKTVDVQDSKLASGPFALQYGSGVLSGARCRSSRCRISQPSARGAAFLRRAAEPGPYAAPVWVATAGVLQRIAAGAACGAPGTPLRQITQLATGSRQFEQAHPLSAGEPSGPGPAGSYDRSRDRNAWAELQRLARCGWSATREAGLPDRRGFIACGTSQPVSAAMAARISRTEKPLPVPRLEGSAVMPLHQQLQRQDTCRGKIGDVEIIAHRGAVRRVVVVAEHRASLGKMAPCSAIIARGIRWVWVRAFRRCRRMHRRRWR